MKQYTMQELRVKNNLTQEQTAQKVGISKDYVSLIERGKRSPSDKIKNKFAELYNVPVVQIFLAIQRTNGATKEVKWNVNT